MTVSTALQQGVSLLEDAAVPSPHLTAEVLLCHALGWPRTRLYSHGDEELSQLGWIHFGRYLHERMAGKPTQYITKRQEFYGREFRVTPDVLIPRPETEHVIETALRVAPHARSIVDIGTGSGAIAVTLAAETHAAVCATDISLAALRVARVNAERLHAQVSFIVCDVAEAIAPYTFDVVASNPPYVGLDERDSVQREVRDFEPSVAVFAGPTGLEIYERLIYGARRILRPGGWLVMELGYRSLAPVKTMLDAGWSETQEVADLAGVPRVLAARFTP